jgi:hypothetical protein
VGNSVGRRWGDCLATVGRLHGRQWGGFLAAYGEILMALDTGGEGSVEAVPRFNVHPVDGMGAQLFPCSLAMGTPQTFPMASPPARSIRLRSRPWSRTCTAAWPRSIRFEPVTCLRGFHHWFTSGCTSPSRLPGMGHLMVLTHPVVVGAAPTLPCAPRVGLPPASEACCDRPGAGSFIPPGCMARLGAPPNHVTQGHQSTWRASDVEGAWA